MDWTWVTCEIDGKQYTFTYDYDSSVEDELDELIEREIEERYKDVLKHSNGYSYWTVEY